MKDERSEDPGELLRRPLEGQTPEAAEWPVKQNMDNKRYIRETGQETRIAAIIEPVAEDLGYHLVRVRVLPQNGCTLQIMAEDDDGNFTISDCEKLSQEINPVLDVEDPIDRAYHLEVSSPGVDRPLVRARDFERWTGHEARLEMSQMIDGRKRFRGMLEGVEDDQIVLNLPDVPMGADPIVRLPLSGLAEAKLIMTDALLEAARIAQENDTSLDDPDLEQVEDNSEETN